MNIHGNNRSWGIWDASKQDWIRNPDGTPVGFKGKFLATYHMRRAIVGRKRDPASNLKRKNTSVKQLPT